MDIVSNKSPASSSLCDGNDNEINKHDIIYLDQLESCVKHHLTLPHLNNDNNNNNNNIYNNNKNNNNNDNINHQLINQHVKIVSKSTYDLMLMFQQIDIDIDNSLSESSASMSTIKSNKSMKCHCTNASEHTLTSLTINMIFIIMSVGELMPVIPFVIRDVLKLSVR